MSEHKAVAVLPGDPDTVFAYLADVHKLSAYLPMVTSATWTGREDAVLRIQAGGVRSSLGVWVRAYSDRRQLAWGTVDNSYRGEVHVTPQRGDDGDGSVVTITLESDHHPDEAFRRALDAVTDALSTALRNGGTER